MRYQAALRPDQTTLGFPLEQSQDVLESLTYPIEDLVAFCRLRYLVFRKLFPRPGNRKSAFIQQFLDSEDIFDVLPFIYAVPRFRFLGCKIWKFGFPKTKNVRLDAYDLANFGDLEKELIWNLAHAHAFPPSSNVA